MVMGSKPVTATYSNELDVLTATGKVRRILGVVGNCVFNEFQDLMVDVICQNHPRACKQY